MSRAEAKMTLIETSKHGLYLFLKLKMSSNWEISTQEGQIENYRSNMRYHDFERRCDEVLRDM